MNAVTDFWLQQESFIRAGCSIGYITGCTYLSLMIWYWSFLQSLPSIFGSWILIETSTLSIVLMLRSVLFSVHTLQVVSVELDAPTNNKNAILSLFLILSLLLILLNFVIKNQTYVQYFTALLFIQWRLLFIDNGGKKPAIMAIVALLHGLELRIDTGVVDGCLQLVVWAIFQMNISNEYFFVF